MGQAGDQSLSFMQNKTLAESAHNGVEVHLAEVHREGVYTYVGRVRLDGEPYSERQPGSDGKMRRTWVFPLVAVDGAIPLVPAATLAAQEAKAARSLRRLTDDEVRQRAENGRSQPGQRPAVTTRYERDPHVAENAKRRAKGICELCNQPAPFKSSDGDPYLETHHIIWLAKGGPDTIENTAALCPNCHRKMHVLNLQADQQRLKNFAKF
jgi:5-methylcytosine-specific restriction protein A